MEEQEINNSAPVQQTQDNVAPTTQKKHSRLLWVIFLVFIVFVTSVFLTQKKEAINWVKDYQTGIELAKQQNKPLLLAFYKKLTPMSTGMSNTTYNNPEVKKYVEENFIPVLIDVDEHPEIAKKYKIDYYPTHYIKKPDSEELFGPRLGHDPPKLFINELKILLNKMHNSEK